MLTMRFVAVRDVLDPSRDLLEDEEEGLGITTQGNNNPNAQWSIQVQHGGQRQRTRSIAIATKQKPGQEASQQVKQHHLSLVERQPALEITQFPVMMHALFSSLSGYNNSDHLVYYVEFYSSSYITLCV